MLWGQLVFSGQLAFSGQLVFGATYVFGATCVIGASCVLKELLLLDHVSSSKVKSDMVGSRQLELGGHSELVLVNSN